MFALASSTDIGSKAKRLSLYKHSIAYHLSSWRQYIFPVFQRIRQIKLLVTIYHPESRVLDPHITETELNVSRYRSIVGG
jgi:hypothetical protein